MRENNIWIKVITQFKKCTNVRILLTNILKCLEKIHFTGRSEPEKILTKKNQFDTLKVFFLSIFG